MTSSTTFTQYALEATELGHYAVQVHSRSPILVPVESSYKTLLVFNTNLHVIVSDISLKARHFGLHFCCRKLRYIFNHFYAVRPGSYRIW